MKELGDGRYIMRLRVNAIATSNKLTVLIDEKCYMLWIEWLDAI